MSVKKTIARSFTVETIEDGISVQAQYAPNANPTSSQIHNVWQDGDLFMRTRETDSTTWSAWHRIVGENGSETDYSFGISQYRTTENAQTAPSDISSWSDAPLAVTTAKPYLWSKVQQKSWNESTQQYVVDSTRYIRLTGEEGVVYDIQTPVDSIHIGENQTSATLSGTAKFYKKEGTKDKVQTVFYYGVYKRTGTTFTKVATGNANSYAFSNLAVANTVNAVVIYLFASPYTGTDPESQTYLCKREMLVVDAGNSPYFADLDNEMDSVSCNKDGVTTSAQTVVSYASMWKGNTKQTITGLSCKINGKTLSTSYNTDGYRFSYVTSTGYCEIGVNTGITIATKVIATITITATIDGVSVSRDVELTINGARQGANGEPAAIYKLIPSDAQIVKKKDGTYTPSGNITCSVTKNVGGTSSTPSSSEYTLKMKVNGGSEQAYAATAASSITSKIEFILYVNSVVVDRETVPLVSDGDKGNDGSNAPYVELSRSTIIYKANNDGQSISSQDFPITYALKVKGNTCTISSVNDITITLPTNVTIKSGTKTTSGCTINCTHSVVMSGVISITITGTYDGVSYTATGTITVSDSREGQQGEDGESAPVALANPDKISVPCGVTGYVSSALTQGVTFSLKVGTHAATVTSVSAGTKPTGVSVTGVYDNAVTITISTSATASGIAAGVTFTITGTYNDKTYTASVTVALIGAIKGNQGDSITGPRGKTGRFYYYGGEFDSTNNTKTFIVNDAETPYFSHGVNASTGLPNCHVYNPSENGTLTMAQMWTNSGQSWNNAPWQVFTNDFQYLITRAIFGDYAHFGSFIINGDWLISQYGKINGVASTAYTKFYPEFVNGGDLCADYAVNVSYVNVASAYFIGGKTYYIRVSGSNFSSGCQLNARMYNGSSTIGSTVNLTSSNPSATITFTPTTSGTYYLRADCQSGGMTANLTAYVDCFVPNVAIDGLTGKTYQNDAVIKGNIYRPALTINNSNYTTYAPKNSNNVYIIDLKKTGLNILLDFDLSSGTLLIDLPYGDEYIGAEVTIINNSNKCAYIETILWGEGDASFPIYGYSGYAHFKYVKVTNSLGYTTGKWWVLGSMYDPGNYVNV